MTLCPQQQMGSVPGQGKLIKYVIWSRKFCRPHLPQPSGGVCTAIRPWWAFRSRYRALYPPQLCPESVPSSALASSTACTWHTAKGVGVTSLLHIDSVWMECQWCSGDQLFIFSSGQCKTIRTINGAWYHLGYSLRMFSRQRRPFCTFSHELAGRDGIIKSV